MGVYKDLACDDSSCIHEWWVAHTACQTQELGKNAANCGLFQQISPLVSKDASFLSIQPAEPWPEKQKPDA